VEVALTGETMTEFGKEPKRLQKKEMATTSAAGPDTDPTLGSQINNLNGKGSPLPEGTRAFFENSFGRDFRDVRIHSDSQAQRMARSVNALAFTAGSNIVFGKGQYAPETGEGNKLIAHELTHVVQQADKKESPRRIMRWGADDHGLLTQTAIDNDKNLTPLRRVKELLKYYSGQMDKRGCNYLYYPTTLDIQILSLKGLGLSPEDKDIILKLSKGVKDLSKDDSDQIDKLLYNYLDAFDNPITLDIKTSPIMETSLSDYEAPNHGEANLYKYTDRTPDNIDKMNKYLEKALEGANQDNDSGISPGVLIDLGDALHVGQDRGAHGEGLPGEGHGKKIKGWDPDDPSINSEGYKIALIYTQNILKQFVNGLDEERKRKLTDFDLKPEIDLTFEKGLEGERLFIIGPFAQGLNVMNPKFKTGIGIVAGKQNLKVMGELEAGIGITRVSYVFVDLSTGIMFEPFSFNDKTIEGFYFKLDLKDMETENGYDVMVKYYYNLRRKENEFIIGISCKLPFPEVNNEESHDSSRDSNNKKMRVKVKSQKR
jgi:hypothetical protein